MIRHCVMLRLRDKADRRELTAIIKGLADLVERLDGCSGFYAGPNLDFEDKSGDYPYGFTLDARDEAALAAYAVDPDHVALGARLVDLCEGGAEGIVVFDLEAPE